MWKGRCIVFCAASFLCGNFVGGWITLSPILFLALSIIASAFALLYRRNVVLFAALFFLGAASLQIGRIPEEHSETFISQKALSLKNSFSHYLENIISDKDELAILKALAIGDKSDIDSELKKSFKESGTMHLLALSGLHVGIIYAIISSLLSLLGGKRIMKWIRSIIILLFLWGFAIISGLSSSIFRAVLMITTYEVSKLISADKDGPGALATSAFIITLLNPEAPREIGFQLSFCAVLSIYTIYPYLKRLLNAKTMFLRYIWNTLAMTISCQIGTGVISYYYFGSFPVYFMLANLLSIPLMVIIMYLIAASLFFSKITSFGFDITRILSTVIHTLNEIMLIISDL